MKFKVIKIIDQYFGLTLNCFTAMNFPWFKRKLIEIIRVFVTFAS